MAALLSAMNVFNNMSPPYASAVLLELYNTTSSGQLSVQAWYSNSTNLTSSAAAADDDDAYNKDLFPLTIPGQ